MYRFEDLTINKQDLDKECTRLQQTIIELDATCQVLYIRIASKRARDNRGAQVLLLHLAAS